MLSTGPHATRDRYVAGLLATMLPLGRLPTSMLWGQHADVAGRRPALIGSMLGIACGNLAFGFARSLCAAQFGAILGAILDAISR